jgi:hypothetical protein
MKNTLLIAVRFSSLVTSHEAGNIVLTVRYENTVVVRITTILKCPNFSAVEQGIMRVCSTQTRLQHVICVGLLLVIRKVRGSEVFFLK